MANETSKQMHRRCGDRRFSTRWIKGYGIDIGSGKDPLSKLEDFFPLMKGLRPWDIEDGDAMLMLGINDESFDFVHSTHCLEHLNNPELALENWIRICKKNGHLIITIPDEDLYEQGVFPSTFNTDHKWTFTINKNESWSNKSINVIELLKKFTNYIEIIKIEKLDSGFIYGKERYDQTLGPLAESGIEIILKKINHVKDFENIETFFNEAIKLQIDGKKDLAKKTYEKILALNPAHVPSLINISILMPNNNAILYLKNALEIEPNNLNVLINLGFRYYEDNNFSKACRSFELALSTYPNNIVAINGLLKSLNSANEQDNAIKLIKDLDLLKLNSSDIYFEVASIHENSNNTKEAVINSKMSISIDNNNRESHILLGRQLFKSGDYLNGAKEISWIWKDRIGDSQIGLFIDKFGKIINLKNKIIVIFSDSGLGDAVQFIRYAKLISKYGATVILECQEELHSLFKNSEFISEVYAKGNYKGASDYWVPMHNLIGAFGTTIETIPSEQYIIPSRDKVSIFKRKLDSFQGINIGLCWYGNNSLPRNKFRSLSIDHLAPIINLNGYNFFSLHKESPPSSKLIDISQDLIDIDSTAALISCLDLVISVDSLVAHLAGSIGRPVWLLNRFDSCWRWLEHRDDSPWYPSLKQYRQSIQNDWSEPIANIKKDLLTQKYSK